MKLTEYDLQEIERDPGALASWSRIPDLIKEIRRLRRKNNERINDIGRPSDRRHATQYGASQAILHEPYVLSRMERSKGDLSSVETEDGNQGPNRVSRLRTLYGLVSRSEANLLRCFVIFLIGASLLTGLHFAHKRLREQEYAKCKAWADKQGFWLRDPCEDLDD